KVDLSILHRSISKGYQSVNGNAFTENTMPVNENGLFAGISFRLTQSLKLDAYADLFSFPWLKYLVDAPSTGKEYLAQFTFTPNKKIAFYTRYKHETKSSNLRDNLTITNFLVPVSKQNWRTQFSIKINNSITLRQRTELMWYNNKKEDAEDGFLSYLDFLYKPMMKKFAAGARIQYFETESYNSRLYAYENDVLYNFSIPPFSGAGIRYYININYVIKKKFTFYVRFAQTNYKNVTSIGSGNDEIMEDHRYEIKFQLIARW